MKTLQKFAMVIVLMTLTQFASGQSGTDVKQILSKSDTRKEIMDMIANDSNMSKEMIDVMHKMKGENMDMKDMQDMKGMNDMKDMPGKDSAMYIRDMKKMKMPMKNAMDTIHFPDNNPVLKKSTKPNQQ